MKMTKKAIASIFLAGCTLFASACQTQETVDPKLSQAPDYSKYTHSFNPYAYNALYNGIYTIDGEEFDVGEDFRTLERMQEYRDAGLKIVMAQSGLQITTGFDEEKWEEYKVYMDYAHEAGLKVLLQDSRLRAASNTVYLVGEDTAEIDYEYDSQEELDEFILECMRLYKDHPAFYGVTLSDEPDYDVAHSYGIVYKTIQRLVPDCYVQYNLFCANDRDLDGRYPPIEDVENATEEQKLERRYEQFRAYLELFLDETGADYVCYDHYPMQYGGLEEDYIRGLQVAAEVCKERGVDLHFVTQTFGCYVGGDYRYTKPTVEDLYWQNNLLLGFGVKELHYYTYWTGTTNNTNEEVRVDGASFMTYAGEKTYVYYTAQKIMAQNQQFANVIKQFDYQGSRYYIKPPCTFSTSHIDDMDNSYLFKKVTNVDTNKEVSIVTELYDSENDNYLYMVMNALNANDKGSRAYQTNTVTFSSEYTHVVIYKNGVGTPQKLDKNNAVTVKLAAGEAVYLLPY